MLKSLISLQNKARFLMKGGPGSGRYPAGSGKDGDNDPDYDQMNADYKSKEAARDKESAGIKDPLPQSAIDDANKGKESPERKDSMFFNSILGPKRGGMVDKLKGEYDDIDTTIKGAKDRVEGEPGERGEQGLSFATGRLFSELVGHNVGWAVKLNTKLEGMDNKKYGQFVDKIAAVSSKMRETQVVYGQVLHDAASSLDDEFLS